MDKSNCATMLRARRADTREQVWTRPLTIGRVVRADDIPAVPSRPGGPCTDIAPYYGAQAPSLHMPWHWALSELLAASHADLAVMHY